jgi:hypothetical protein
MEVSDQLHASAALPPVSIYKMLDGSQVRSGRCGRERKSIALPRTEPRLFGHPTGNTDNFKTVHISTDSQKNFKAETGQLLLTRSFISSEQYCVVAVTD